VGFIVNEDGMVYIDDTPVAKIVKRKHRPRCAGKAVGDGVIRDDNGQKLGRIYLLVRGKASDAHNSEVS
jgi:hypothetical protein